MGDDDLPTSEQFVHAIDLFYAMPEPVRRRLLCGWTSERWPKVDDVHRHVTYQPTLVVHANGRSGNGLAQASHELRPEDAMTPVRLHVAVGTAKQDVVKALWDLWYVVETQWPALTAVDPEDVLDEPLPIALSRLDPAKHYPNPSKNFFGRTTAAFDR